MQYKPPLHEIKQNSMFLKLIDKIVLRLSTASMRIVGYSLRRWTPESRFGIANANVDSQMQSRLEKVIFALQGFAVAPAQNSHRQSSDIKWSLA